MESSLLPDALAIPRYVEGEIGEAQVGRLRHLAEWMPQWYVWGLPSDSGKARKVPRTPRGEAPKGKTSDPSTAGTLDEALAIREQLRAGGVGGLVSAARPGLVGVDLDNVVHGTTLHPLGLEALERFGTTYAEVSPSGTGLRIFALGTVPPGTPTKVTADTGHDGKSVGVEMYAAGKNGRWLRCTGLPLDWGGKARDTVAECQAGIEWLAQVLRGSSAKSPDNDSAPDAVGGGDNFEALAALRPALHSSAVLERMKQESADKPRGRMASALRGDLAPWSGDHSAADLFLCIQACRLGCDSHESVCEVWRGSQLSRREKWARGDYRARTVAGAAAAALTGLRKARTANAAPAAALPSDLLESLTLSGDKLVTSRSGALVGEAGNVVVLFRNHLRISAIVDACFRLIVDGRTAPSVTRRGGAQELVRLYAESSTIRLKRTAAGVGFLGYLQSVFRPLPGRRRRPGAFAGLGA